MSVGLSILSWRGADSLALSLESYASVGLFSLFEKKQIFLPDPDESVLKVAQNSSIDVRTETQNLGIMGNMVAAARSMSSNYILMLENDCPIIETKDEAERQISKSLDLLKRDDVIMARLRSVAFPGQAFTGLTKYRRMFDQTPRSRITRRLRPGKVKRLSGYALYDSPEAIQRHQNAFEDVGDNFYLVDAEVMPWTNQSILVHRETFLNVIVPMAQSVTTQRGANNLPTLEIELNKSSDWRNSGWKIACGPGLFTHERTGDRGYA